VKHCSAALRLSGSAALRLCGSAALRLCGSAALRLCGSVALLAIRFGLAHVHHASDLFGSITFSEWESYFVLRTFNLHCRCDVVASIL
jgi:hypothetical protein